MVEIVEEKLPTRRDTAALHRAVFGGEGEAALVERLWRDRLVVLSLVATEGEQLLGHLLFSNLGLEIEGRPIPAVSLAPLAVLPARQGQGIGSALMKAAMPLLRARGVAAVLVLGHPGYYRRFGFWNELTRHLDAPFAGEAFMALELLPGVLTGSAGQVSYPSAFGPL